LKKIRSGGQIRKGWGKGSEGVASRPYGVKIFARPRFSAAEFRASEAGAPLKIKIIHLHKIR
jgi:hypothetical protein